MREALLVCLLVGCGNDVGVTPDAVAHLQPRVIAGGGIGDGPIAGVVNLYVIDDVTRSPVAGAIVQVGTVDGTTDATGLFVAEGVTGPQTIVVKAPRYRSDVWVGVNGANVTVDLEEANAATPPSGTLTGTITNFGSLAVAAGHMKLAVASYSQRDELGDAENELAQPADQNICFATPCSFKLTSRIGKVAVVAAIFDRDLEGTLDNPDDDTQVLLGWAVRTGITVTANATQAIALDLIPAAMTQDVTVSFGSPPASLTQVASITGIDAGEHGMVPLLPFFQTPTNATLRVPKPEAIATGASYRVIGFAANSASTQQSIVVRRGQTTPQLSTGAWLAPPTGTVTRTTASWSPSPGATVSTLEYKQGGTKLVNVTVFDASTTVTLPASITLPTGSVTVGIQAIGALGLDVTSFSLDADRSKLSMVGGQTISLPES